MMKAVSYRPTHFFAAPVATRFLPLLDIRAAGCALDGMTNPQHRLAATADSLRTRVLNANGLLSFERNELPPLVGKQRFRLSPEGEGEFVRDLAELLSVAGLGLLPIGRESETLERRVRGEHRDGVFGELGKLDDDDQIAIFDKRCYLGRVLLLAGNPGNDYQCIARSLETAFAPGSDTSSSGIRAAAVEHGGFVVVRRDVLLGSVQAANRERAVVEASLGEAGLLPLPVRIAVTPRLHLTTEIEVIEEMGADDLVGVCLSTPETNASAGLQYAVMATVCRAEQASAVGGLMIVARGNLFDKGPTRWSSSPGDTVR